MIHGFTTVIITLSRKVYQFGSDWMKRISTVLKRISAVIAVIMVFYAVGRLLYISEGVMRLRVRGWDTTNPIFQGITVSAFHLSFFLIFAAVLILVLAISKD